MEGLSPQTLHNLRFRRLDEEGNTVNVWNFGDLEELLKDFEVMEDPEEIPGSLVDLDAQVETPSPAEEAATCVYRSLHTPGSVCRGTCLGYRTLGVSWPVDIYVQDRLHSTPDCERFYEDMPSLEGPDEYQSDLAGMPDLESAALWPVCNSGEDGIVEAGCSMSAVLPVENELMFRVWAKEIHLAATVLLVRAICAMLNLPEEAAHELLNAMVLLYAGIYRTY